MVGCGSWLIGWLGLLLLPWPSPPCHLSSLALAGSVVEVAGSAYCWPALSGSGNGQPLQQAFCSASPRR